MRIALLACFCLLTSPFFAQQQTDFNLEFVSSIGIEFPDSVPSNFQGYTDVWGWEAADGRAYAIVGAGHGSAIFDVTNAESPVLAQFVPGTLSRWRDFKSYENYIYIVADEGADGLTIVDMSAAPDSITWQFFRPEIVVREDLAGTLGRCHNLYIDNGYAYLSGCALSNNNRSGVLIFDLNTDPETPIYLGNTGITSVYSHDVYVQNDVLYSSDFSEGRINIWDVSDKTAPEIIAGQETGRRRAHNAWVSDDDKYLFTTDETSFGQVGAYDISQLDDIRFLDAYNPEKTYELGVIPHNVHYHEGYLVTSYYTDGLKVIDAHRPENLVEVGSFDSYLFRDGGFSGVWGAFPFTSSGLVYQSDRSSGLWILRPTYERAAYVEGRITDGAGNGLDSIRIEIESVRASEGSSKGDGSYGIGLAASGLHQITFNVCNDDCPSSRWAYPTVQREVDLVPGEVIVLDIVLAELASETIAGTVVDDETGEPIANSQIIAKNSKFLVETTADASGAFQITVPGEAFVLGAAKWGWNHGFVQLEPSTNTAQEIRLSKGIRDDFAFDLGWQVDTGEINRTGIDEWERGIPVGARYDSVFANPDSDLIDDFGASCYVTGLDQYLAGNLAGTSLLTSPNFDGTQFTDPFVNYSLWYFADGVLVPDDFLQVYLGNGTEEVLIEELTESATGWRQRSEKRIIDFIELSSQMYFKLVASDTGNIHIYEAGLDGFSVTEGMTTSISEFDFGLQIAPNPFTNRLVLDSAVPAEISIRNLFGQEVFADQGLQTHHEINLSHLPSGTYVVILQDGILGRQTEKIVKF